MFKDERGSVITEFALVVPIVLLVAFGALQLLFLANAKIILQQAAFDAVRSAAVYPGDTLKAAAIVREQTQVLPIGEGQAAKRPIVKIYGSGDEVQVKVTATIRLLPLIKQTSNILGGNGSIKLVSTAMAKREPYLGQD